ncbi:glycosyltransferase family 2 protein [Asticcacaulis sp. 201]|uniref:glycosyltransferase family 2 protein n=1 Tax=Asticcacaulis sp. 201 TaxID=3028787 RepID=UPI00291616BC|nr:glycosyltransferase [Asticcacaulis sp. 201]MDV6331083.1 glycosyltransferase [Asticcacaulis sp. 201]
MMPTTDASAPFVSVIMANYNGARHLAEAIRSVLCQSHSHLELIFSDDASSDDSVQIATDFAAVDSRVKVLIAESNSGPARARNRAIAVAKGDWIAIVDSDDILHPDRFLHLLNGAAREQADIVADELMYFHDGPQSPTTLMFSGKYADAPFSVTAELFVRCNSGEADLPNLGYLKPIIRSSVVSSLRYDETLKIGEDYDFLLRAILSGAAFVVFPIPSYFYRRHSQSISHRLSAAAIAAMIANHDYQQQNIVKQLPDLERSLVARRRSLEAGLRFANLVDAVKQRKIVQGMRLIGANPQLLFRLGNSFVERLTKAKVASSVGAGPSITEIELLDETADNVGDVSIGRPRRLAPIRPFEVGFNYLSRTDWRELANIGTDGGLTVIARGPNAVYAAGYIRAKRLVADDFESSKCHV